MLPNTLNTNEVKNAAGVEVEFNRLESVGRKLVFAQVGETPSLPHRLTISHTETGEGMKRRRRSVIRVDKTTLSPIDNLTQIVHSDYYVKDTPVGAMNTTAESANVTAELLSFLATTGAATTVLFDGTGWGAKTLIEGAL